MIIVRLLISEGSWLVLRVAENATLPVPERTDMPRALPDGSAVGLESHTTRHFPSNVIGSVSFWQMTSEGSKRSRNSSPTKTEQEPRQGEEGRNTQGIAPCIDPDVVVVKGVTKFWFQDGNSQMSAQIFFFLECLLSIRNHFLDGKKWSKINNPVMTGVLQKGGDKTQVPRWPPLLTANRRFEGDRRTQWRVSAKRIQNNFCLQFP